jgi:nucleolar protein 9
MPRENRKRGRKHKKQPQEKEAAHLPVPAPVEEEEARPAAGPSWIKPAPKPEDEYNAEAPFGYVDADVKAYFRTVDLQIREWAENAAEAQEGDEDHDPNEGAFTKRFSEGQ